MSGFVVHERFYEVGTPEGILESRGSWRRRREHAASNCNWTCLTGPWRSGVRSRDHAADPARRRRRPRALHRHSGAQRGTDHRRVHRVVPRDWPQPASRVRSSSSTVPGPTPELALQGGARVLRCPKRGLGRAYIDADPLHPGQVRGDGRRRLHLRLPGSRPFVEAFREGFEFVMGSRWKGSIETGIDASAPPVLRHAVDHVDPQRPVRVAVLRHPLRYARDDHRGARNMQISSQSWEYASEIVLKSVHMSLRTTEVPVHFLQGQGGQGQSPSAAWVGSRRSRRPRSTSRRCSSTVQTSSW